MKKFLRKLFGIKPKRKSKSAHELMKERVEELKKSNKTTNP